MLERCRKEKPNDNEVCYYLALIYYKPGMEHKTRLFCNEILARDANHAKTKKFLARLIFQAPGN